MSIMEISHRSKEYEEINSDTQDLFRELLQLPDDYKVLFLQGGASTQFSMIPMNFLSAGKVGSYIMTGAWAEKAIQEARKFGEIHIAASGQSSNYKQIPTVTESQLDARAAYLHITTNETIIGSQFHTIPYTGAIPLIADMSSDILSRPIDASRFALIYAGAQKNLGPSGVTVVIIRSDLAQKSPVNLPEMLKYDTHIKSSSLYNTPPVFSVYIMNLVLKWIKQHGGLGTVNLRNHEKVKLIYDVIDQSGGFYEGLVETDSRSLMNITFKVMNDEVEKEFLSQAEQQGFIGLQGHRSVGHIRASTYNALPYEACKALADFMATFLKRYG